MFKLNREELIYGAVYGIFSMFWVGLACIIPAGVCAIFWALGGSVNKAFRRCACPGFMAGFLLTTVGWSAAIGVFVAGFGAMSLGYGIPDSHDEGSYLGRVFMILTEENYKLANVLTRIAVMLAAFLSIWIPTALFR